MSMPAALPRAAPRADLSLIPSAAIDHVEVLLDGAAAQYGTDAIAGVVNIILKKKSSGGQLSATMGDYYDRGDFSGGKANGDQYDVSYNMGLPLFDKGFVNFTIDKQFDELHPVWRCRRSLRQRPNAAGAAEHGHRRRRERRRQPFSVATAFPIASCRA